MFVTCVQGTWPLVEYSRFGFLCFERAGEHLRCHSDRQAGRQAGKQADGVRSNRRNTSRLDSHSHALESVIDDTLLINHLLLIESDTESALSQSGDELRAEDIRPASSTIHLEGGSNRNNSLRTSVG